MEIRMKRKIYFVCSFVVLVLWMFFIFGMSAKSGEESADLSYKIAEVLYRMPLAKGIFKFATFHTLIRKLAHFTEYGILELLVINFIYACDINLSRLVFLLTVVFCFVYAATDEYHQSFVDSRSPGFMDVCIDTAGATLFLLIFLAIRNFIRNKNYK